MPLWEKTQNHMYSMNIGLIHFTTFNFDLFGPNPSLQPGMLEWLEADLKRANEMRDKWPWLVVINHRPLYCSNILGYHVDCIQNWQTYGAIDDLLYKYKVDLYISGHAHSYERYISYMKIKGIDMLIDLSQFIKLNSLIMITCLETKTSPTLEIQRQPFILSRLSLEMLKIIS